MFSGLASGGYLWSSLLTESSYYSFPEDVKLLVEHREMAFRVKMGLVPQNATILQPFRFLCYDFLLFSAIVA